MIESFFLFSIDIEADFKTQLQSLIPEIFRADNENFVKEINGEQITSTQLFEYFRVGENNGRDYECYCKHWSLYCCDVLSVYKNIFRREWNAR